MNIHCCCNKTWTKLLGCHLYSGIPSIISSPMTPHLVSYVKGLLDTSSVFVQSSKWFVHVSMKWRSHNRDLRLKLAEKIQGCLLGHFRAFRGIKIGVGHRGYTWGSITRGYVVLGKYDEYSSMPSLALILQSWGFKKLGKKTILVRGKCKSSYLIMVNRHMLDPSDHINIWYPFHWDKMQMI